MGRWQLHYRIADCVIALRGSDAQLQALATSLYEGARCETVEPDIRFDLASDEGRLSLQREGDVSRGARSCAELFQAVEWRLPEAFMEGLGAYCQLHAAVAVHRGRAIVLCGAPEAGKTSLVVGLALVGAAFYSHEVALFHPERKCSVKLYVKRVFITNDCEHLLPSWLRFLRGVIDSEDLPLNVSRELLQNNPVLARIKAGVTSRVLNALAEKAEKDSDAYVGFWDAFGPVLKEGLYEDFEHREKLLNLLRFRTTAGDELISLDAYKARMKDGQEAIYYIAGDELEAVRRSPQLEGFRAKGIEVLLMTDPIDEFWLPSVGVFEPTPFKSVTRGSADLEKIDATDSETKDEEKTEEAAVGMDALIAHIKLELGASVKDVRSSARLTDSAVCLVADDDDLDMNLQRILKQHGQLNEVAPRVLELNPKHALISGLAASAAESGAGEQLKDAAHLLLDQARIIEGEVLPDPTGYAKRMADIMAVAFAK